MPVCRSFLAGTCFEEDCPYSHVYVDPAADVCDDFLKGFCPHGSKCKQKHIDYCQSYRLYGFCPQGDNCKLKFSHRPKRNADKTLPPSFSPSLCPSSSSPHPTPPLSLSSPPPSPSLSDLYLNPIEKCKKEEAKEGGENRGINQKGDREGERKGTKGGGFLPQFLDDSEEWGRWRDSIMEEEGGE
uniref:C3H1-type domain-containing protein n=2 Tax=Paramoeba aestuarina TaxID=180227 RepID=A0A7S4U8G2_9EUKA|mmetsp:Transcript_8361/g.12621  ORF Transcript_8361/g.12621 Transcript_8361/m.12621 type:complete len:185 (+) Transcript_8361:145-699(+)